MKNKFRIIGVIFLFSLLLFFRNWITDCFTENIVFGTWEETVNKELKKGYYAQNFICRGELQDLTFYLNHCKKNTGRMKVWVTEHAGKIIKGCEEQIINFSDYSSDEITFTFHIMEKTRIGHTYTMVWECECIGDESQPVFEAIQGRKIFQKLSINDASSDYRIYAEYNYKNALSVKKFMIFCFTVLLLVGIIFLNLKIEIKNLILMEEGIAVTVSVIGYLILELLSGNLSYISFGGFLSNTVPIYIFISIIWMISKSIKFSAILTLIFLFLIGTANHYILLFKGNPILPWELYGIKTAVSVASSYEYTGSAEIFCAFVIVFVSMKLIMSLHKPVLIQRSESRWIHFAKVLTGCILYYAAVLPGIQVDLWEMNEKYREQGFVAAFLGYARYEKEMSYDEPTGYSEAYCRELIERIPDVKTNEQIKAKNLIVIMNESFADFRVFGNSSYHDDTMPFLDSLRENTVYGNLYVPVFGGVTANTEFEFLTGISCAYTKSIPYEMYIKNDMDSLARLLDERGYRPFAFHPYHAVNWNRDDVYPRLGFEKFFSIADMEEPEYLRWCVSDASDYSYLIENYEKHRGEKYFMFNVTMQNHGGYAGEYKDLEWSSDLSEMGKYPMAETYLSCIRQSDEALEKLIDYFENIEEPTMICFFGDHQPVIEDAFYEQLFGKGLHELTIEENLQRYVTPFYIWANYDIHEEYISKISANYLMAVLLKTAGYDLKGFEAFLYQLYLDYPVITTAGIVDAAGNSYASAEELEDTRLTDYGMLQYYQMQGMK